MGIKLLKCRDSIIMEVLFYLLAMIPFFISVRAIGIITIQTRLYNWLKDRCIAWQNNTEQFPPPQVIDFFII